LIAVGAYLLRGFIRLPAQASDLQEPGPTAVGQQDPVAEETPAEEANEPVEEGES
jgi:hypothetical protein